MLFYRRQTCGHLMFGFGIVFFYRHVQKEFSLFYLEPFTLPGVDYVLQLAMLLLYFFSPGRIIPEVRGQGLPLQAFKLVLFPV